MIRADLLYVIRTWGLGVMNSRLQQHIILNGFEFSCSMIYECCKLKASKYSSMTCQPWSDHGEFHVYRGLVDQHSLYEGLWRPTSHRGRIACNVWGYHGKIVTPWVYDQTSGTRAREHYDPLVDGPWRERIKRLRNSWTPWCAAETYCGWHKGRNEGTFDNKKRPIAFRYISWRTAGKLVDDRECRGAFLIYSRERGGPTQV